MRQGTEGRKQGIGIQHVLADDPGMAC